MSVEAISWALNLAPVPRDVGGKTNPACKAVLIGLANHADPDGKDAFPAVRRLMRYTELSERTVRTALDRLEAGGIIRPCDPAVVAAKIKRADHRPKGWDLAMHLIRDDLDEAELAALGGQFPGLAARVHAVQSAAGPSDGTTGQPGDGVQPLHPAPGTAVDNEPRGVRSLHPVPGAGCSRRGDGVQPFPERGAVVAPEPSIEPPLEPSAARPAPAAVDSPGEAAAGEFFDLLGPRWRLTAWQRGQLAPAVHAAIGGGWDPAGLARFAGANADGVRSPYAVLTVRLSPGHLPSPPARALPRPPWCGICDETTRMLGWLTSDTPRSCPRCKSPADTAGQQEPGSGGPQAHRPARPAPTNGGETAQPPGNADDLDQEMEDDTDD